MSRAMGLYGDWSVSYLDAGNEVGNCRGTARVVVGTDAASNISTQIALYDAFVTALNAITLGDLTQQSYVNTSTSNATQPTNGAARELKLQVFYQCVATGKRYQLTIPTLDPTIPVYIQNVGVKDAISMTTPASITTLISAFNAFVVANDIPNDGSDPVTGYATDPTITVIGLKVVGRNN